MKKLLLIFCAISSLFIYGCSNNDINKNSNQSINTEIKSSVAKNSNENIETINISASMVKTYNDINELASDSVLIIEGSILANNYINFKDTVFTISTVKVTNILKDYDNIKVGDTINLLQTGGIETIKQNANLSKSFDNPTEVKKNIGKKVEVVLENSPVLKEGQPNILFLTKYDGPITKDAYIGTGDFQGRFLKNGDRIQPQSAALKSKYNNKNIQEFTNGIKSINSNK
ncbi:hypothetical protein OSC52_01780 [Clostridium pasteurianum]|uniref:hypothetical protein n=1 Tax=Clostridium pasteurianum TaxID=1501 RepID=UPI00226094BC|nr:hypothetical protein [Clostridium pasteurianum]UZW14599.1 hypothetical protein OSC52_01780 [Clostridium pasteurianum]